MELGLNDKRVLVSGASGNIGRATAVGFGSEGARVAVGYHTNQDAAQQTARLIEQAGGRSTTVKIDLADPGSLERGVADIKHKWGGLDVLVNNAVEWGEFPRPGEVFETAPLERFHNSVKANLLGQYVLARLAVGLMRREGWGRIVHVSTGLVEDGLPGVSAYVAAKSGLHGLTRVMSRELAAADILTNLVMGGFVLSPDRPMPEEIVREAVAAAAIGRTTEAEEVARLIMFLCSAANTVITGELIRADGHFLTRMPAAA